jgi:hypothetical protein
MLRIFVVMPAYLLFLLLSTQAVLIPGNAWAWCCGATCKLGCTCRGTYPCVYNPGDDKTVQAPALTIEGSSQMDVDGDASPFIATTLDFTDSFSALTTGSKCFRDKLTLSLLGNARAGLNFVTFMTDTDK